jgi:hypothetical protein
MYRFARSISDTGAQHLVKQVCGPAHQCARRILWQIDAQTPLEDSEASGQGGIRTLGDISATHAFQACSFDHSDTCPEI